MGAAFILQSPGALLVRGSVNENGGMTLKDKQTNAVSQNNILLYYSRLRVRSG